MTSAHPGQPGAPLLPRGTTYAGLTEVVLAVADARPDPATDRFDAELADAVRDGRVDTATARTLRWWQRESLRGMRSYLAEALPSILTAMEAAADGAEASVEQAAIAWSRASGASGTVLPASPPLPAPTETPALPDQAQAPTALRPTSSSAHRGEITAPAGDTSTVDLAERRRREVVASLIATDRPRPGRGPEPEGRS